MTLNKKDIKDKSLKAVKYTIVLRTLSQMLSVIMTVLLVRILSEHEYGVYNLLYSIIGLLGMVASFGLAT